MITENFNRIKNALKGKNRATAIGQVVGIIAILFIGALVSGAVLIFGLNLMGLNIDYTLKTCLGACLVILIIRPAYSSKE